VSEKSFAIGTIAETLQSMGDAATRFVLPLYPVVMATVKDDDEEVRSNAVYGLGVLMANGGAVALTYPYCQLFTTLCLKKKTSPMVLAITRESIVEFS